MLSRSSGSSETKSKPNLKGVSSGFFFLRSTSQSIIAQGVFDVFSHSLRSKTSKSRALHFFTDMLREMGRGVNQQTDLLVSRRGDAYETFARENLHVYYLSSASEVEAAIEEIKRLQPTKIALDFETVSKNGAWGVMNGSLSLIQLGVNEPDRGITPQQWLIDCHMTDPHALAPLLEDDSYEKLIHYLDFELEWAKVHLGVRTITPIYDTCAAWRVISKKLREMPLEEAQKIVPGWDNHNAKLDTLVEHYLGFSISKQEQTSDWGQRPLSAEQVVYAATDVAVLPHLTEITQMIAAKLGLTNEVTRRINWIKSKVHERVGVKSTDLDDYLRIQHALMRASSAAELDSLWHAARQMTVSVQHLKALQEIYNSKASLVQSQS